MRSVIVYQAADGKAFLSDSANPGALNENQTWISDDAMKQVATMHLHMQQVGGAIYFFRSADDGTGLYLAKMGCATKEAPAWREAATKLATDYLSAHKDA